MLEYKDIIVGNVGGGSVDPFKLTAILNDLTARIEVLEQRGAQVGPVHFGDLSGIPKRSILQSCDPPLDVGMNSIHDSQCDERREAMKIRIQTPEEKPGRLPEVGEWFWHASTQVVGVRISRNLAKKQFSDWPELRDNEAWVGIPIITSSLGYDAGMLMWFSDWYRDTAYAVRPVSVDPDGTLVLEPVKEGE